MAEPREKSLEKIRKFVKGFAEKTEAKLRHQVPAAAVTEADSDKKHSAEA